METAAVDFETYYSSDVGVEKQGVWQYCRHPEFDAYLVTIAASNGLRYCGRPEDFDWGSISGEGWRWVSHNRSFDLPVYESLVEKDKIPHHFPAVWECSADLCAYMGAPRSLKNATESLLEIKLSKDTRNKMKGKRWEDMTDEFRREVEEYAIKDAEYCLQIWEKFSDRWPEEERWLSRETTRMGLQGVPINLEGVRAAIERLKTLLWEAELKLPWVENGKPVLSPLALSEECRAAGVTPPKSLAEDSPECEAWENEHGERFPWVGAMRQYRKCNALLRKLEAMLRRARPDGWMDYSIKYFGATTGRDSGGGGNLNMQNLQRMESYGVNIRKLIEAPKGHVFIVADLSQIEPRCLAWLARDHEMLEFIKQSPDLYEAQARAWGFWDKPEPLKTDTTGIRHLVKQLNLGLGYGMGVKRFTEVTGLEEHEAKRLVRLYRSKNPKVDLLWKRLENNMRAEIKENGKYFSIELPSGRQLRYRHPNNNNGHLSAEVVRGGNYIPLKWWGGSLTENATQAMARDVFMGAVAQIRRQNIEVILRVHDEVVAIAKESEAEQIKHSIETALSTPPVWATDLPLACEAHIVNKYQK